MSNRGDDGLTPYEPSHPRGRWHAEQDCPLHGKGRLMTERPAAERPAEGGRLMSKQSAAYDAAAKPDGPRPAALPSLLTLGRDELTNLLTLVAGPESAERGVVGYAVALAEQLARLRHRGRVMSERPAPYDAAEPAPAAAPAAPSPWEPYAVIHLGDVTIPRALFSRLREAGFVFLTHSGALESGQVAYLIALGLAAHERGERAS